MATSGVQTVFTKEQLRHAITSHKGRITPAANSLGVWYRTLRKHIDSDPELVELVATLRQDFVESTMDKVEDCINDAMDNRSVDMSNALKAAFFFANNHGKERGYNPPVINQQGDIKITPDQLRTVKEAMIAHDTSK